MNNTEYNRLLELKKKINSKRATKPEKDAYMTLMYKNGNITKKQYDDYFSDNNSEEIINAALTIGGVMIAAWLLSKVLED